MRVVLDTNVVISAALNNGSIPRQAFDNALTSGRILVSDHTLAELDETLCRPKFQRYVTEPERLAFLAKLVLHADLVEVKTSIRICRDPKDDMLLELAEDGKADCIVTGDLDLLSLHPFRGIMILTPQQFLEWCREQRRF